MPQPRRSLVDILNVHHAGRITPAQWGRIESFLDAWEAKVLAAAKAHPARSYRLGMAQVEAFADLLRDLGGETSTAGAFGGVSPSMREALQWERAYTLNELQTALRAYTGAIKDALLYALRGAVNPTIAASLMYKATRDATINWRAIARTELVRANAAGRLAACRSLGYDKVWSPPHAGACKRCRSLLENRVFAISEVEGVSNFGRSAKEWVACIPLHPHCRHSWLPYEPEVYALMQQQYTDMAEAGLMDDDNLDEWFDSSGQLKPQYEGVVDFSAAKTVRLGRLLGDILDPLGGDGLVDEFVGKLATINLAAPVEGPQDWHNADLSAVHADIPYTHEPAGLDPLLFEGLRLRGEVRERVERAWEQVAGADWRTFSRLYLPTHQQPGRVDAVIDYPALRAARPDLKALADTDLHLGLVLAARRKLDGLELAPGMPLVLRLAVEHTSGDYAHALEADGDGGPVWALGTQTWLHTIPAGVEKTTDVDWSYSVAKARGDQPRAPKGKPEGGQWIRAAHHNTVIPDVKNYDDVKAHLIEQSREHPGAWTYSTMPFAPPKQVHFRNRSAVPMAIRDAQQPWLKGCAVDGKWVDWTKGQQEKATYSWGKTLLGSDEFEAIAKQAATAAPNSGVEHWITIHPHGEDEKGQPVLVRNNADGTMTVVGGAGGNLNYLRLDPKRRIDREKGEKAKGSKAVEQPVSEEEAQAKQAEREQEIGTAREQLAKAQDLRGAHQEQLHAYLRDELGVDVADLDGNERRRMLAKAKTSALRTLAYGPISARDANEGADREDLGLDKPDAPKPLDPTDGETDSQPSGTPRPQMGMTDDQAKALMDLFAHDRQLAKIASAQRKVIAGDAKGADAAQIDWSMGGDDARERKRSAAIEQELRTSNARTLLEQADNRLDGKGKYKKHYREAFQQGGFDSVDAFAHSILGHGVISKEASNLLGVAGAAALVAHAIQGEAQAAGKRSIDLAKVQSSLQELTDEQERAITDRGLTRVRQATERAAEAKRELQASKRGESLYTTTMANSIASEQYRAAQRALGMMVGGLEATSALKTALDRKPGEKIKVGGFASPASIKELAAKARVKITTADITRVGAGNYTLSLAPERLEGLLRHKPETQPELRARLKQIRTGDGLDKEIEAARTGPGMSDVLDRNQARGKLFLQAAGSGLLGFDPGVGKTHVAIATAEEKMAAEPGKHKALIVAPTNMLQSWANTIKGQGKSRSISVVGSKDDGRDEKDRKKKIGQLTGDADYTIISYESLKAYRADLAERAASGEHVPHSIVIADELQKAKNDDSDNFAGVERAIGLAREHHGDGATFMGLTGTPVEKDVSDVGAMVRLVRKAKGQDMEDKRTLRTKYGKLGQDEHIARGDKIQQFRKGLDTDLFRLSAHDAGNDLGEPTRHAHTVDLSDGHRAALQDTTNRINRQIEDAARAKAEGTVGPRAPNFGGRDQLLDALYNHASTDNSFVRSVADQIEKTGSFDFKGMPTDHEVDAGETPNYMKGDHAGAYEHKHVVFGASEMSTSLFGTDPGGKGFDKAGKGGLAGELRKRGVKVFVGHGQMGSNAANDASYKAFLAHEGKAVFVTNDKNNAGISLQFGDNKGDFQYGATQMHHLTRPVNNATIQQREARILRKGAAAGATYHTYSADTPTERRLEETLQRELRTQDLAANSEQQVSGADTLRHHLDRQGTARQAA